MLNSTERSLRARIGGFALSAIHDPRETTKPARAAFLASFEREVDPDRVLSITERARRAAAARKAHFAKMALKSVQARRLKNGGRDENRPPGQSPRERPVRHSTFRIAIPRVNVPELRLAFHFPPVLRRTPP